MSKVDDGGAASAMSMRDHFAGLAMQGEIASYSTEDSADAAIAGMEEEGHESVEQHLAVVAYRIADAMIAEKRRTESEAGNG